MTRLKNSIPLFNVKHNYSKNSFFLSTIIDWKSLDSNLINSEILVLFKKDVLAFIRLSSNSNCHCHNPNGLTLIARLRLGLSHLRFHRFKRSFQDTLNLICNCSTFEATIHYLLHCPNFSNERLTIFNKLQTIDENILSKGDSNISKGLIFSEHSFNDVNIILF